MLMSELIEQHEADPDHLTKTLARCLKKTGPVMHAGYCWSGHLTSHRYTVKKDVKRPRLAKNSAKVEVPWGLRSELLVGDLDLKATLIDRFRGYIHGLESGTITSGKLEDVETLGDNLVILADDLRHWVRSERTDKEMKRIMDLAVRSGYRRGNDTIPGE
jgi:predicted class III extradiol MEMO1 family dioxygenase